MSDYHGLTERDLVGLCKRAFPDRANQRITDVDHLPSRQHEMLAFGMHWSTPPGESTENLIARRYISTLSWWRPDDLGKAQRESTVTSWLYTQGFPVPKVYTREFGALGDIILFSRLPGQDWRGTEGSFSEVVRPHIDRFAELLALLHSFEPAQGVLDVIPSVTLPSAVANLMGLAVHIGDRHLIDSVNSVQRHAYAVIETERVVLHGDYHFSNALLLDGQISGIVDWEYCALGDPRWDIANAYNQLVDFDAASAADEFLNAYLRYSGRKFDESPLYMVVVPLQQWMLSEWLIKEQNEGRAPGFAMAQSLIEMRDVHRRRARRALEWLNQ